MQTVQPEMWLIMLLGETLTLSLVPKGTVGEFRVADKVYREVSSNFLTSFYDRIVDDEDRLIGIRLWPVTGSESEFLARLPNAPYLQRGAGYLDIWLSEAPIPDAESTGDQAFGGQVYLADSGALAISVDINFLCASEDDFANVKNANARWIDLARPGDSGGAL